MNGVRKSGSVGWRWLLAVGGVAALLVACGGGGSSSEVSRPDSRPEPTTEDPDTTVPRTTAAPTTTIAPWTEDLELVAALDAVEGYLHRPATGEALGEFAFVLDEPIDGFLTGGTRAVATAINASGDEVTVLVLKGTDPTDVLSNEDEFLKAMDALTATVGGSSEWVLTSIEIAVEGSTPDTQWLALYHQGIGYLILSDAPTPGTLDDYATALSVALHGVDEFAAVAAMEGTLLPNRFIPLADGCYFLPADPVWFDEAEILESGNSWRDGEFPLAQHFAVRALMCGDAQGSLYAQGSLSIVEMHEEFAAHVSIDGFLDDYASGDQVGWSEIGGVRVVEFTDGALRWFQGPFFYQLFTAQVFDADSPDGRPSMSPELMKAIATQLIENDPTGTSTAGGGGDAGTTGPTVTELADTIGCDELQIAEPLAGTTETGRCTLAGVELTISTYAGAPNSAALGWSEFCEAGQTIAVLPGPTFAIAAPSDSVDLLTGVVSTRLQLSDSEVSLVFC